MIPLGYGFDVRGEVVEPKPALDPLKKFPG
jgi:hypothetical protein